MGYEDFTTYTEVDAPNRFTQTSTRNTVTDLDRDENVYVYKSYGSGHFGDFTHYIDVQIDGTGTNSLLCWVWVLANTPSSWSNATDAIGLMIAIDAVAPYIRIQDKATSNQDYGRVISLGVTRYLILQRSGTTLTCKIYDTAENRDLEGATGLQDTLTITCSNTTYEYCFCGAGNNDGATGRDFDGFCENFNLTPPSCVYKTLSLLTNLRTNVSKTLINLFRLDTVDVIKEMLIGFSLTGVVIKILGFSNNVKKILSTHISLSHHILHLFAKTFIFGYSIMARVRAKLRLKKYIKRRR